MLPRWIAGCGFLLALLSACTSDPYETGDGSLSYMRADFVDAYTTSAITIANVLTDDGDMLALNPEISCPWEAKADTVYRALFYYDTQGGSTVKPVAITPVSVLRPFIPKPDASLKYDPVAFESAWMSRNGSYLNLGLYLKTGKADDEDAAQSIGLAYDSVVDNGDGTRDVSLVFVHSQNGVPEYYSTHVYVSIPMSSFNHGDKVSITLNTYNGKVVRTFEV